MSFYPKITISKEKGITESVVAGNNLLKSRGELVGTRGCFCSAADAFETSDDLSGGKTCDKSRDALSVSVAAASERYRRDYAVGELDIDGTRACAGSWIMILHDKISYKSELLFIGYKYNEKIARGVDLR